MPAKIPAPPKDELADLYLVQKKNMRTIGDFYGVNKSTIKKWLVKYEIPVRLPGYGLEHREVAPPTKDDLYDMVYVQGLFYHQVAAKYGVHESAIGHWLVKHGLGRAGGKLRGPISKLTKNELIDLYRNQGRSLASVGEMYDASAEVVARLCKEFGIEIRPEGWAGKSFTCKDHHIVKSTYELKVDNWLYDHGIDHIYEPKLPFGRRMQADFLANGWYIEVWGVIGNNTYNKRKRRKIAAYNANNMPLIEIPVHAFDSHRNNQWIRLLEKCLQITSFALLQEQTCL